MSASAISYGSRRDSMSKGKWINSRSWDLTFNSMSDVLVTIHYLIWLFMSDVLHIESDIGRQGVNILVPAH